MRRRLERALDELTEAPANDHVVINADLTDAVRSVSRLLDGTPPTESRAELDEHVERLRAELAAALAHGT
jgi:guanylate kinase